MQQDYLDDVRDLLRQSEYDDALELVNLWLEENSGDVEARLLKTEICLNSKQDYAFIGACLTDFAHQQSERLDGLRTQSGVLAWELVREGREKLRGRYPNDALRCFDDAMILQPKDAVIPLAAGLALLRAGGTRDLSLFNYSPFDDARRRLNPAALKEAVEKYMHAALAQMPPDERPYEVAAVALVKYWLGQDLLTPEMIQLLDKIVTPSESTTALIRDCRQRVATLAQDTLTTLLRSDLRDKASQLIKICYTADCGSALLALYEAELVADQPKQAATIYRRALKLAKGTADTAPSADDLRTLLVAAQNVQVKCPHCGKKTRPTSVICPFCETSMQVRPLLMDTFPGASEVVLAQLGLAEALVREDKRDEALKHWQMALELLPDKHQALKPVQALYERIAGVETRPKVEQGALRAVQLFDEKGISVELTMQISRVNEIKPDDWFALTPGKRAALIRKLIAAGQLKLAGETLAVAFADKPGRKSAADLQAQLDEAIHARIEAALTKTDALISAGRAEEAITLASRALELRRDARLLLARGNARLAAGSDLAALEDFFAATSVAISDDERYAAHKAAALVLERRWNISGARAALDRLNPNDPDVMRARARLERRAHGEPVVLTERVAEGVMEDTLTRKVLPPYYHGYFALAVREIGFPMMSGEAWYHKLMNANYEFVQVLGALRDVMGDAIFVLRSISHPHRQIPERGTVTVALLVRVSAQDEGQCRARALQLWTDINAILPLAQENVYIFEPVVDDDELQALLTPFEFAHAAEIVHREFDMGGVYTVSPFMPGTVDLHNLHWVFLRQTAPAMISIHLKPTNLLPWERSTSFSEAAEDDDDDYTLLAPVTPTGDEMNRHLARVQLWEKLQMKHVQLNYLRYAYLLRVYIAGSAGTSQLLPEMTASAMFGPLRDNGQNGGYEIIRAGSPQEFDVIRRNLSALDVESWMPSSDSLARFRYLVGEGEATQVFRLPIPGSEGVPGMVTLEGKPVVPPVGMPEGGVRLGVSVARMKGIPLPITQSEDDRRRHLYVVGKTGMGKSTLLLTLILQDIEAGRGVFLLDPHGDLCEDVLARIPSYRADDVVLLDPSDAERPVGLNILDAESEADQHRIVNDFIGLLMRMYDPHNQAIVGPIFQQNVRNAMLAAMSMPDGTLIDVYRLLSDGSYVKRVLPYIKDPLVRNYWEDIASRVDSGASAQWKAELLPYLLSKFSRFVEDSTLRRMIGQPRTSVQWGKIMEEGKILLVNLAKGRIGQENSQFIGSLVLSGVLQAAFRRGEIPAARRREFYIYIDEVQNYSTPMLATMLSEGRKFGVILTIANQFLHQLDFGIREAVFGNVGSLVAFRVGTQDAPALAPEFFPVFSPGDLLNLPQFTACVKLLIDGVAERPFSMRTLPAMVAPDLQRAELIRELSRQRYGTDMMQVQQDIMKKF